MKISNKKISKHLFYTLLVMLFFGIYGCEDAQLVQPLIVDGISINDVNKTGRTEKYKVTFIGKHIVDAMYYTDKKYNVGDTLK